MGKNCRQCTTVFEISEEDLRSYDKLSPVYNGKKCPIPPPTLCPDCRKRRRLAFRNERNLYNRSCGLCQKNIVAVFSPANPRVVYCQECWWSDSWDSKKYGKAFDFNKTLADQMVELMEKVPLPSSIVVNCVNCDYTNQAVNGNNCYLSFRIGNSEDILYSYLPLKSLGCVDCYAVTECQFCYECVDCWNCYGSSFCRQSKNLSNCSFCFECIGTKNCFGCVGLRNVEYYFFNQKYSKEEYEQKLTDFWNGGQQALDHARQNFNQLILEKPQRSLQILNSQNASGDYIANSKAIFACFDVEKTDTARYSWGVEYSKDVYDSDFVYYGELSYESMSNSHSTNILFSPFAYSTFDLLYCVYSFNNSHNCLGCVSSKKDEYCILNKQYTKEEYEELVPRIIAHMTKTGEWGEFLPSFLSPFGYNETLGQEFYPLTKETALVACFPWSDYEAPKPDVTQIIPASKLPDNIRDVPDDILNWAIECEVTKKPFRIIKQELDFYREHNLPIPRRHPEQRHKDRLALRNPRKLWDRNCMKCNFPIQTTYSPDRKELVYCDACYLKEVY